MPTSKSILRISFQRGFNDAQMRRVKENLYEEEDRDNAYHRGVEFFQETISAASLRIATTVEDGEGFPDEESAVERCAGCGELDCQRGTQWCGS